MNNYCDPETGVCTPSTFDELSAVGTRITSDKREIIYIGDPMCSWCWGISPALIQLRDFYAKDMSFRTVVGGLRPGGGDVWNHQMKEFLKHHWEQVHERSGQPFGYALMDLEDFNYDTEPACRAVVTARSMVKEKEMEFFEAVQRKFYVDSQDPTQTDFYRSICDDFNLNFEEFKVRFESDALRKETINEFNLNRRWGIQGYPAVILLNHGQLYSITRGYAPFEDMKNQVELWLLQDKSTTV